MNGADDEFRGSLDTALGTNAIPLQSVTDIVARGRAAARRRTRRRVAASGAACIAVAAGSILPLVVGGGAHDNGAAQREAAGPPTPAGTRDLPVREDPKLAKYYRRCATLVKRTEGAGKFNADPPTGRVGVRDTDAVTVVIANSRYSWTCNVKPDRALSAARRLDAQKSATGPRVENFALAVNSLENYKPKSRGTLAWGGGLLPKVGASVDFTFPSGDRRRAVVSDGFWVVQYTTTADIPFTGPPTRVRVDTGRLSLSGERGYCNQISHGC